MYRWIARGMIERKTLLYSMRRIIVVARGERFFFFGLIDFLSTQTCPLFSLKHVTLMVALQVFPSKPTRNQSPLAQLKKTSYVRTLQ